MRPLSFPVFRQPFLFRRGIADQGRQHPPFALEGGAAMDGQDIVQQHQIARPSAHGNFGFRENIEQMFRVRRRYLRAVAMEDMIHELRSFGIGP